MILSGLMAIISAVLYTFMGHPAGRELARLTYQAAIIVFLFSVANEVIKLPLHN